jgi:glutathione S-transferase
LGFVIGRPIRIVVKVHARLGLQRLGGTVLAMGAAPRLYYMPRTRSSRVLWMLEEIGAPYELSQIAGAERRSAEHLKRHPLGRVPALELRDGTTIFESAAICLQLADLYPEAELIPPPGSPDRALAYQWVVFGMTELEAPLFRWIRDLSQCTTESPERERFADAATAVESALGGSEWLLGHQFTVADVICASVLAGANSRDLLREWPGVRAYVERDEARPAYDRAAAVWDRPRS